MPNSLPASQGFYVARRDARSYAAAAVQSFATGFFAPIVLPAVIGFGLGEWLGKKISSND